MPPNDALKAVWQLANQCFLTKGISTQIGAGAKLSALVDARKLLGRWPSTAW